MFRYMIVVDSCRPFYPVKGCCLPGVSRGSLGGGRHSKVGFRPPRPLNNPNPFGQGLRIVIIRLRTSVPQVLVSPPPDTWRVVCPRYSANWVLSLVHSERSTFPKEKSNGLLA